MIDELSFLYQYSFFSGFNFTKYLPSLFLVRLLAGASFFIAVKNGVPLFLLNSKYLKWISDLYREVSLFAEWIINASNAILKRRFLTEEESLSVESGVPALTKAAGNLLCVVCCFNTPKLNSNGEEKKYVFLMPVQKFVVVLCLRGAPALRAAQAAQAVPGNGDGNSGDVPALMWAQPCSSCQGDLLSTAQYWGIFWDLPCALCSVEIKLLVVGLEGIGAWGLIVCLFNHFLGL